MTPDERFVLIVEIAAIRVVDEPERLPSWSNEVWRFTDAVFGPCVLRICGVGDRARLVTEAQAKDQGFNPITVTCVTDDKAHYYPDASTFVTKMIADRDSHKLLGIQVAGAGSVAPPARVGDRCLGRGRGKVGGRQGRASGRRLGLLRLPDDEDPGFRVRQAHPHVVD